jgi:hypothetical protein
MVGLRAQTCCPTVRGNQELDGRLAAGICLDVEGGREQSWKIYSSVSPPMGSVKRYMRPGQHKGTTYGIEVWQLETGAMVVDSIYLGSLSGRKLVDDQRREFGCVEDAFLYGAEFARKLLEN